MTNTQMNIYVQIAASIIGTTRNYTQDHWSSDWNGEEVGFDDVPVVGLYRSRYSPIHYYVNTENGEVLDAWVDEAV